jgi:hypothetical protein
MPRIKRIDLRAARTFIRYGKTDLEIQGGKPSLRDWIREKVDSVGDDVIIALMLSKHLKDGGTLENAEQTLAGKDITLTVAAQ